MKHSSYIDRLTEVQNCFEQMTLGNNEWQKVRHRRNHIRKAHEYAIKHNGKILKESLGSRIKRIFSREPPLFKYDYSLPYDKLTQAEEEILKIYKQRYHPFIPVEKAEDRRLEALKRIGSIHSMEKPGTRMDFVVDDEVFPLNYGNDDVYNNNYNNTGEAFSVNTNTNGEGYNDNEYNDEGNRKSNNSKPPKSCTFPENIFSPPYANFKRSVTSNNGFRNVLLSPPGFVMPNEIEFHSPIGSPHAVSPLVPKKSPIISLRKNPFCSDEELCLTINPPPYQFGALSNKRYINNRSPTSNDKGRSYSAANAYQYPPTTTCTEEQQQPFISTPIRIPISPPRSPANSDSTLHYISSGSNADEFDVSVSEVNQSPLRHFRLSEEDDTILQGPPQLIKVIQISPIKPRCLSYSNGEQIASVCSTMRGRKITLPKQSLEEDENMQNLRCTTVMESDRTDEDKDNDDEEGEGEDEYRESDEDIDYDKYINSDKPKYKLTKNKD